MGNCGNATTHVDSLARPRSAPFYPRLPLSPSVSISASDFSFFLLSLQRPHDLISRTSAQRTFSVLDLFAFKMLWSIVLSLTIASGAVADSVSLFNVDPGVQVSAYSAGVSALSVSPGQNDDVARWDGVGNETRRERSKHLEAQREIRLLRIAMLILGSRSRMV